MRNGELFDHMISTLERGGIEGARFEADQLLQCTGTSMVKLFSDPRSEVDEALFAEISTLIERRLSGEPLQYILGEWDFFGIPFLVGEGVLIPRQDTEILVELCMRFLDRRPGERRTLDLCAGSGCIGIALEKLADAEVTCVEKYERAFEYLRKNIAHHGASAEAVLGDVLEENTVRGEFDLIVSNPPYLTEADMRSLQREVEFEPKEALYGGEDGLDFYRRILAVYPQKLKSGGMLAVEIGMGQENAVGGLFRENGIEPRVEKDWGGICRVVWGIKR